MDNSGLCEKAISAAIEGKDQTGLCIPRNFRVVEDWLVADMPRYNSDLMDIAMEHCGRGCYVPFCIYKQVFLFISMGLRNLHAAGIVHRDIKPENMLVDARYQAALADFGTATTATMTPRSDHYTLGYIPPEAFCGNIPDQAGDIWAFGASMLTVIASFQLDSSGKSSSMFLIHAMAALNPKGYNLEGYMRSAHAPTTVMETIEACMEMNPKKRITAQELYDQINAW